MGNEVYAIVCGAIRQEFEFLSIIYRLCEMRHNSEIKGIVLSTWYGEVDSIPNLRSILNSLSVHIVESDTIDEDVNNYANLNYIRQSTQLLSALKIVPDDSFILKCRTDFNVRQINLARETFLSADLSIKKYGYFECGLQYKIAVLRASVSHPFDFNDTCFYGYKSDIKKMIVFESTKHLVNNDFYSDGLFFLNIFLHKYSIISEYIDTINYWAVGNIILNNKDKFPNEFILPSVLNKFYALYFIILDSCFLIVDKNYIDSETVSLRDIFVGKKNIVSCGVERSFIFDSRIISKIVDGKLVLDDGYTSFLYEIKQIKEPFYADRLSITLEDYEEFKKYGKMYFEINSKDLVRSKKITNIKSCELNLFETFDLLFSNYSIKTESKENLYKLICEIINSANYGDLLIKNLSVIRAFNEDLFITALFTASRSMDDDVLLFISKMLYENKIPITKINQAEFIFIRYAGRGYQMKMPMNYKRMAAVYYYSLYANVLQTNAYKIYYKEFFKYCNSKNFQSNYNDFDKDINYQIKEKINLLIIEKKYAEAINLINFLKIISSIYVDEILVKLKENNEIHYDLLTDVCHWSDKFDSRIGYLKIYWSLNDPVHIEKIKNLCSELINDNNSYGYLYFGKMYEEGKGVDTDLCTAIKWVHKVSKINDEAQLKIFDFLEKCKDYGFVEELKLLASFGYSKAEGYLGRIYRDGVFVNKDLNIALDWMKKAVDDGIEWAKDEQLDILLQLNMPEFYDIIPLLTTGTEKEKRYAFNKALKLESINHGEIQYQLGLIYQDGKIVEKNNDLALNWFLSSARNQNKKGTISAIDMLLRSNEESCRIAFGLCEPLASSGHAGAQFRLAFMYHHGKGIEHNDDLAKDWLMKSRKNGYIKNLN